MRKEFSMDYLCNSPCNATIYYKSGDKYSGELVNGEYHGHGIYYFKNGEKFEGLFAHNLRDGYGETTFSNGDIFACDYKNGRKNGYATWTKEGDTIIHEYYEDDKLISSEVISPNRHS